MHTEELVMKHKNNTYAQWQKMRARKLNRILGAVLCVIVVSIVIVVFVQARSSIVSTPKVVESTAQPAVYSETASIFQTPYFEFETDKNWKFIANESTDAKFTYSRTTNGVVEATIMVYIDSKPEKQHATRVLPVSVAEDSYSLNSGFVSEHCNENIEDSVANKTALAPITLSSISFVCDVQSTAYTVSAGIENATDVMSLDRPNGEIATYMIYFNDFRLRTDPNEFEDIINTFQVR